MHNIYSDKFIVIWQFHKGFKKLSGDYAVDSFFLSKQVVEYKCEWLGHLVI